MGFIYGLFDPRDDDFGYVGKTEGTLEKRLKQHLQPKALEKGTHKNNWIKKLLKKKVVPEIQALEELPAAELDEAEQFWIAYYRGIGVNLRNQTPGGEGCRKGSKFSDETRQKMSVSKKGKKQCPRTAEWKEKIAITLQKGRWVLDETDGKAYRTVKAAAQTLDIRQSYISMNLTGRRTHAGGHVFRYVYPDAVAQTG